MQKILMTNMTFVNLLHLTCPCESVNYTYTTERLFRRKCIGKLGEVAASLQKEIHEQIHGCHCHTCVLYSSAMLY